ncbi:MAG: hypothetical protein H6608_05640 [Flavobacteriales bacterium]|nr:hypothetical protein [Flavobacteriales bacterium]
MSIIPTTNKTRESSFFITEYFEYHEITLFYRLMYVQLLKEFVMFQHDKSTQIGV